MISQVVLDNVLAFRSLALDLRGLTVLSGTNSAGKSSVLHALALLRQSDTAGMLPASLLLNGELVDLGNGKDLLHQEPVEIPFHDGPVVRIGVYEGDGGGEWVAEYQEDADVLRLSNVPADVRAGGLFAPGFQYLKADRIVPAVTYPKSHEAVSVRRFLGARGEHAPNFLRTFGDEALEFPPSESVPFRRTTLADHTRYWLGLISPGTFVEVRDIEGTDFVRLSFERTMALGRTSPQRATNVGFGLTYALPIVVGCLMSGPGSLILLENPEAHLHPSGQAVLGRLCALAAARGAQVVVETHSDHVLNAIRLAVKRAEIRAEDVLFQFFARDEGVLQPRVEAIHVEPDGMLPSWPAGFFDQWDRSLTELLD